MLPMPGAPSSSWNVYQARLKELFRHTTFRVCAAFFLLGVINNVIYVIILSAALDLVGPTIPKSAVLLFDVVPSFLVKLTAPYYIHIIPYRLRVLGFVALSTCGMLLIALTPSSISSGKTHRSGVPDEREILVKMSGVVLASLSSGGGELSFLGLTSFYGPHSLASWGSGTGGAGLIGAGAYVLATSTFGLSVRTSLLVFSFLPVVMLLSFFIILPKQPLAKTHSYDAIPEIEQEDDSDLDDGLLDQADHSGGTVPAVTTSSLSRSEGVWHRFKANVRRAQGLVLP